MYKAPRGTVDILPEEQASWRYVEDKIARICQLYGYERIDTPIFEEAGLFRRSVGEGTDIVDKEMYIFTDKGGNDMTLKPEGTAPTCRAYLEHGMFNLPQPVKLYYIANAFRYERPQAGRLRQHHQFGVEVIGEIDPVIDAEVIDLSWQFLVSVGLNELTLYINNIGCRKCRPAYIQALKSYYERYISDLCPDCRVRIERNTLRLLDCKVESCQAFAEAAPKYESHLCPDCAAHFEGLKRHLNTLGIPFSVNHRLVRGLDYYTRTVFEIQPLVAGSQSTICGGGRYDDLIEELGGKPTPAIGFATGMERIILNLKKQEIRIPQLPKPLVFIAFMGNEARSQAVKLAAVLRREGIGVQTATGEKSLKAQLRQANNFSAKHALIIGEEEVKAGTVVVRDMVNASQQTVPVEDLVRHLNK